jgi:GNAT superfamily N-acetyltransferase
MERLKIRDLQSRDIRQIVIDFQSAGITRDIEYFDRCVNEVKSGQRVTLVATVDSHFVGTAHLLYNSHYPHFRSMNIPEINDLVVFPKWRKNGIGEKFLGALESIAKEVGYKYIGLGVGLYCDYGHAQRLYVKRGYVPDGYGVFYDHKEVAPGNLVRLDDDLNLCLIKELGCKGRARRLDGSSAESE